MSDATSLERAALNLLAAREHSRLELKQKLNKHNADNNLNIDSIIDKLITDGYQSDLRYAVALIRYRANKGYGWRYIQQVLQQKGISSELIDQALVELDIDWSEVITCVYQKRYHQPLSSAAEKQKRTRFLMARGFEFDLIREIVV